MEPDGASAARRDHGVVGDDDDRPRRICLEDPVEESIHGFGGEPEPGETPARVEAWLLPRALEANQNQRTRTARQLGITREGLYKKLRRHGIA